ncbi:MAG: gluconate 2-dehydrogenase subunit 3 family protein [Burkholderiales bacterium]|nr:gluconate 2-dehydrogenase subunit 3 family protein [Burkholderiales bacterium]MCC7114317.1 gluconate 2-dehydrogenase subunit 3 family protein [Burkholderiales bacterium]
MSGAPGSGGAAKACQADDTPALRYLTRSEANFLDAAVARLVPADDLGPGAREAGVTVYIDRQLAGSWGVHGRAYRSGPWREGSPQQGYQSPLTPQELYRQAIRDVDAWCVTTHGRPLAALDEPTQDRVLASLEAGEVPIDAVRSNVFFDLLLRNTEEGFFADPMYGGNRGKVGWRLIGFPGVASSSYPGHLEKRDSPYRVEPVGIEDIVAGRVRVDAQGYPIHSPPDAGDL